MPRIDQNDLMAKLVAGLAVLALAVVGVIALDVPERISALGSNGLDRATTPTTRAAYGETVRLGGRAERPPLKISAAAPAPVRSLRVGAPKGMRFVGVELDVKNAGEVAWSVPPVSTIGVSDQQGSSYGIDRRVRRIRGGDVLPAAMKLQPGQSVHGVAVFAVPRSVKIAMVQFTVGQGLTRTAEWTESGKAS
jgi:hypothetical protein